MEALLSLLDPDQREYNDLASRVDVLTQKEELRFYELHFKISQRNFHAASELVRSYRERKAWNERIKLSEEERLYMFKILEEKRQRKSGLNRWEYKQLCFLKNRLNVSSNATCPPLPIINRVTLSDIALMFGKNVHRKMLIKRLLTGLKLCLELYNLDKVSFVLGGSFVDDKENPGDIDIALILPSPAFQSDYKNIKSNRIILESRDDKDDTKEKPKKRLDVNKLPEGLDQDLFMVYDVLTLLGNEPLDKSEDGIQNNSFRSRDVFKVDCTIDDIKLVEKGLQEPFVSE